MSNMMVQNQDQEAYELFGRLRVTDMVIAR